MKILSVHQALRTITKKHPAVAGIPAVLDAHLVSKFQGASSPLGFAAWLVEELFTLRLDVKWSVTHATRGREGGQEGGESGYYHLHRNLNQALLLHCLFLV